MIPNSTADADMDAPNNDILSIAAAAQAIFARNETHFTTDDGTVVIVQQAKTRHLRYAVEFIETLAGSMDASKFHNLVLTFAEAQQKAIAEGRDPNALDTAELARAALGNASLLLTVASQMTKELPTLVAVFTNLSVEQVDDLPAEELVMVVCKVLLVNYGFFTQTLRPILLSFAAEVLGKVSRKGA